MSDISALRLELSLASLGLVTLILHSIRPVRCPRFFGYILAALVASLLGCAASFVPTHETFWSGTFQLDSVAIFFKRLFLVVTALSLIAAAEFAPRVGRAAVEQFVLILFAATGLQLVASAGDFILLFVALELITIALYVMVSQQRGQSASLEAGTKYLIMGALSTGFLVYGISYLFGTTSATRFADVGLVLSGLDSTSGFAAIGILFVLIGLSFKLGAVPGQMWVPDVYQGAPAPITGFLAAGSKAAGFVLLIHLVQGPFATSPLVVPTLTAIAAATILYGNLGAIGQTSVKRLLGYSSIAHAGYLLIGVVSAAPGGVAATLFYLAQYAVSSMLGILALCAFQRSGGGDSLADLAGLHKRSPILAASLAVSAFSLAGIPPLSGFIAKFVLLIALVEQGLGGHVVLLLSVALIGVIISLYYYFSIARAVYTGESADATPIDPGWALKLVLLACIAAIIAMGVYPAPLLEAAQIAASAF